MKAATHPQIDPANLAAFLRKNPDNPLAKVTPGIDGSWIAGWRNAPVEILDELLTGLQKVLSGKPVLKRLPKLDASKPMLHHGDLQVGAGLEVTSTLIVTGDLTVDGFLRDCGPDSTIAVGGSLCAGNLFTDGQLCVLKDIKVGGIVYGDYNDNTLSASVIEAPVVLSDNHDIQARVKAKIYIENGEFSGTEPALLKRLVPDVLTDGAVDKRRLEKRMLAGKPVLR